MKNILPLLLRSLGTIVVIMLLVLAGAHFVFRPHLSMDSAESDTKLLLARAGGPEKVNADAARMFQHFGAASLTIFSENDLNEYPNIAKLGKVDGIWPGPPAYIKIRTGNHWDSYILEIRDPNRTGKDAESQGELKVGPGIYVHR